MAAVSGVSRHTSAELRGRHKPWARWKVKRAEPFGWRPPWATPKLIDSKSNQGRLVSALAHSLLRQSLPNSAELCRTLLNSAEP